MYYIFVSAVRARRGVQGRLGCVKKKVKQVKLAGRSTRFERALLKILSSKRATQLNLCKVIVFF